MIQVMFICLGNICRSTMAEFVMKDMIKKEGLEQSIVVSSSATSTEALGWDIHQGTKAKLTQMGIPFQKRRARQITQEDYDSHDYIVAMESKNIRDLKRLLGGNSMEKCSLLLDYTQTPGAIADPWYTGNFDDTYDDVAKGCRGLLCKLKLELGVMK